MAEYLFPDTTVLCNFAAVDRLDLLRDVLDGRGRWTEAVAYEARRSARHLPALRSVPRDGWLGRAIEIADETDIQTVDRIRRVVFGGTDERPLEHLGEAQTCHVITTWRRFAGSWWISDDREALRYARRRGITTRETADLVADAVVAELLTAEDGVDLLKQMAAHGRHLRLTASAADLLR
jgi:hypothetical protein